MFIPGMKKAVNSGNTAGKKGIVFFIMRIFSYLLTIWEGNQVQEGHVL